MKTLDALSQELMVAEKSLVESEGEIDAHLEKELEQIHKDLEVKVDSYAYRIERLKASAEFWKEKSLDAKIVQKRIEDHIERMKERILLNMGLMGKREVSGESSRFYLKPSRASVHISDESVLQSPYIVQTVINKPDKELIYKELKEGKTVHGAYLIENEHLALGKAKTI